MGILCQVWTAIPSQAPLMLMCPFGVFVFVTLARLEAELAAAANQPLPDDEDELLDS